MSSAVSNPFVQMPAATESSRTSQFETGVTELVLSRGCPRQLALLLPMLAHLSRQSDERWITWITLPSGLDRPLLESYGVDTGRIRLIHATGTRRILCLTWEALAQGNSHTVIASPGKLSEKAYTQLEQAAHLGRAQGLLLRMR